MAWFKLALAWDDRSLESKAAKNQTIAFHNSESVLYVVSSPDRGFGDAAEEKEWDHRSRRFALPGIRAGEFLFQYAVTH
jgi:hypothetical protein